MYNLIGLDISKVSTAMTIEVNGVEYLFSYNTKKSNYKWNKILLGVKNLKIRNYQYEKIDNYSKNEISQLGIFINIANDLIEDILSVININDESIFYLEGFSYGSAGGPFIDLIGIASIVRSKIYENIPNIKEIKIIAPKSLKLISCEMVYGSEMVDIGKRKPKVVKIINTNKNKVKGGDFSKHDMFDAIIDYNKDYILLDLFKEKYDEITSVKAYPKPLEDINDSYLLKEIIKFTS